MAGSKNWFRPALLAALAVLAGCQVPPLPDPNDPGKGTNIDAEVLQRNLRRTSDFLNGRVARREIDEATAKKMLTETADKLVRGVSLDRIPVEEASLYGEFFRAAGHWNEAKAMFEVAVKSAKNEDSRVNNTLRLAHCLAKLGSVSDALVKAREAFTKKPEESAPILPAVLLEIAPASAGKGQDLVLAKLLEDAIAIHESAVVDPNTREGLAFLAARPYHVRNAWRFIVDLYRDAGRDDLAQDALERAGRSAQRTFRL